MVARAGEETLFEFVMKGIFATVTVLVVFSFVPVPMASAANPDLQLLAETFTNNRDSIQSWRGTATTDKEVMLPAGANQPNATSTYVTEFKYSRSPEARFFDSKINTSVPVGVISDQGTAYYNDLNLKGVERDGARISMKDFPASDRRFGIRIQNAPGGMPTPALVATDPFKWFNMDRGGQDTATFLSSLASDPVGDTFVVTRQGNLISLELLYPQGVGNATLLFDLDQGGCLVYQKDDLSNGRALVSEYSYREIDGVFVPSSIAITRMWDHSTTVESTVIDTESVNEGIDSSEFSMNALGAREGDLVQDARSGTAYHYSGEQE